MNRPIITHRRLLLFKWLMVFLPPATIFLHEAVRYSLLGHTVGRLAQNLLVAFLALVPAYILTETLFRVARRLRAEALAREEDIVTMYAVMQERERLSRELHDGVALC